MRMIIYRALLVCCLIFFAILPVAAQTVSPAVINTTGGTAMVGNAQMDWSVGEMPLVSTMENTGAGLIITNGLLQPSDKRNSGSSNVFGPEEIQVTPNPATTFIDIRFRTSQRGNMSIRLFNSTGQLVYESVYAHDGVLHVETIDMQRFSISGYYLQIVLDPAAGSRIKSGAYKIIKVR